jgi:hypothetical protein
MIGWILGAAAAAFVVWEYRRSSGSSSSSGASGSSDAIVETYADAIEVVLPGRPAAESARGAGKTVYAPGKFIAGLATKYGADKIEDGERVQVLAFLEGGGGYSAVFEGPFIPASAGAEARVKVDRVVQERTDEFFAAGTSGEIAGLGKPYDEYWPTLQRAEWGAGDPSVTIGDDVYGPSSKAPADGDEVLVVLEEKNPLGAARVLARAKVYGTPAIDKDGVTKVRLGLVKVVESMGPLWGRLLVPKSILVPLSALAERAA